MNQHTLPREEQSEFNSSIPDLMLDISEKFFQSTLDIISMNQNYLAGMSRYATDFIMPLVKASNYFMNVETDKSPNTALIDNFKDYNGLTLFNIDNIQNGLASSLSSMGHYYIPELSKILDHWINTCNTDNDSDIFNYIHKHRKITEAAAFNYPREIWDIKDEYGFHFEQEGYIKVAETERFYLYQILPTNNETKVRGNGKPTLIIPPYVLGADILSFLPGKNKSYAHSFANQGIPTYIRIVKDISTHSAVQEMKPEEDAMDTKYFCEHIYKRHNQKITLNGYCQGGFIAVLDYLSGALDEFVDAMITCVAPIDGTRSPELGSMLNKLPERFNDLDYATKTLPNGNKVVDGDVMSWTYKIKSIEDEAPLIAYHRDLTMFKMQDTTEPKISKTAAAVNYWMTYQRHDLPWEMTKLSFDSYQIPISSDGTLPVTIFGSKLNMNKAKQDNIPWLICYAEKDTLVEPETSLAPLDFVDAEISKFPKGHIAIAVSWSDPSSECALHTYFGKENYRGPVRFQLDLEPQE